MKFLIILVIGGEQEMSKDEILLKEYNLSLEDELCNIDENKLP